MRRFSFRSRAPETFEQYRQRMLDETGRFIEWGLANPELVKHIPLHPVGRGTFSESIKAVFWSYVLRDDN